MWHILLSLSIAALFGVVMNAVYGTQGLMQHAWVGWVTWVIIGSGAVMAALEPIRCALCKYLLQGAGPLCKDKACVEI